MRKTPYTCILLVFVSSYYVQSFTKHPPTILISIMARNEERVLPTFLGYIERLNYPKQRISVLFQTDHNEDKTLEVINEWVSNVNHLYHKIDVRYEAQPQAYRFTASPNTYTVERYERLLRNRQSALEEGRKQWADYLLQVNAANLLVYPDVIEDLQNANKSIVAPMLRLFETEKAFSNYWADMTPGGYYKRHPIYLDIFERRIVGTFDVPMVHSTLLIDLRDKRVQHLQYYPIPEGYYGETDDVLVFAWSAKRAGLRLHVCNEHPYGFIMKYEGDMTLTERHQTFTDIFIDQIASDQPLIRSEFIEPRYPQPNKRGFDEVFVINLLRRKDRYKKMDASLRELGISYKHFPAVDGKNITQEALDEMGIKAMADFKDPYLERPLTFGEIGCFLSHWYIWQEQLERNLDMVLVLEDDIRFEPNFDKKLEEVMTEARNLLADGVEWDILYLGRKVLITHEPERRVHNCNKIVWARYSYWTLGYVLRLSGARQLVEGDPRDQLLPVDEYIPIKFNEHGDEELLHKFYPRDMIGFSADPLILWPTHFVGDEGYFSDTEDTLSFEGKDVQVFRDIKERERAEEYQQLQKEKAEKGEPHESVGDELYTTVRVEKLKPF